MAATSPATLWNNIALGIYCVDASKRILFWNKGAEQISGYQGRDVLGRRCADNILRHVDDLGRELCLRGCPLDASLADCLAREADVFMHHKQGHRVSVSLRSAPMFDSQGNIAGAVEVFVPSKDRLQILDSQQQNIYIDELTGLGNSKKAYITLNTLLHGLQKQNIKFGLLLLEPDNIQEIEQSSGQAAKLQVLEMVSKTILSGLRSMDLPFRWHSTQFLLLLPNTTVEILYRVAEKLRMLVANSWLVHNGQQILGSASLGGTLVQVEDSADTVLHRADQQLRQSKEAQGNCISIDEAEDRPQRKKTMQALHQAWLNAEQAHRQLSRELQTMDELQRSVMPAQPYVSAQLTAKGLYMPSGLAGGDYFDYMQLPEGGLRCIVADVSGHGARAAFIMAMVHTVFHFDELQSLPLSLLAQKINRQMMNTLGQQGDFVTMLAADVQPEQGCLQYINAGHCPGFLQNAHDIWELEPTDPLLGVLEAGFEPRTVQLYETWQLLLYTDGLYECRMQGGDIFGYEPFRDLCFDLLVRGVLDIEQLPRVVARAAHGIVGFNDDLSCLHVWGTG